MQTQTTVVLWWASLSVWAIVNVVNVLQSLGFLSRVFTGSMALNHSLGYVILALALPSIMALIAFVRQGAGWLYVAGPTMFLAFIALMIAVDYAWPIEFRSPRRYSILVPYLVLFFGSIFWMGLPMYRLNRRLWFVTVMTSALLLGTMTVAMRKGVG